MNKKNTIEHLKKINLDTILTILIISCVVISVGSIIYKKVGPKENIRVNGMSMYPTYSPDQKLTMNRLKNKQEPKRYDVVVAKAGGINLIKRVVGLPGDKLTIYPDGSVYLGNEKEVKLTQFQNPGTSTKNVIEVTVPTDCFFLLGDNFAASRDSRDIGAVNIEDIVGIVAK